MTYYVVVWIGPNILNEQSDNNLGVWVFRALQDAYDFVDSRERELHHGVFTLTHCIVR